MSAARPQTGRNASTLRALLNIRREASQRIDLLERAVERMRAAGFDVERPPTDDLLVSRILDLVPPGALVVYHPCTVGEAVGLAAALAEGGRQVMVLPDDLGGGPRDIPWRDHLLAAAAGITGATAVVADTGSLLLAEDLGFGRAASNVPPTHVALVTPDAVVGNLREAAEIARGYAAIHLGTPLPRYLSVITGPSKTADIGLHLVRGMHGPRRAHVLVWHRPKTDFANEEGLRAWVRA